MEILRGLVFLFGLVFSYNIYASGTCTPHLAGKANDKLIVEIEKLNPTLLPEAKTPEELYTSLKNEELGWIKNGYIDYNRPLTETQKGRIRNNYKVNQERLETDYDYSLFYMNHVRLLYVRAGNFIYERILSASLATVVNAKVKGYAKHIIDSFFGHELSSVEMTPERFNTTMKNAPWLLFPWSESIKIFNAWEAQPIKGPRELDAFIYEMRAQYEGKIKPEQLEKIFHSLRARDAIKPICCKSGIGCHNCPLNRRFLQRADKDNRAEEEL